MLAPVLARLERIDGLAEVRVDCGGRYFLVRAAEPGALDRALPAVREVLGAAAAPVEGPARARHLAHSARGELWFDASTVRGLSYVEGRMLAARLCDAVGPRLPGAPGAREALFDAARTELFAALDHAHDTGGRSGPGWFWKEWPAIAARIAARLGGALAPEVLEGALPRA